MLNDEWVALMRQGTKEGQTLLAVGRRSLAGGAHTEAQRHGGGESAGKTCFHTMENGFAEGRKQVSIVWKSVLGGKIVW